MLRPKVVGDKRRKTREGGGRPVGGYPPAVT
jgi:hypothetical protein